MYNRLPIDANVVGYWGFDEANDLDTCIDESTNGLNLTIHGSASAVSSRIGNARQFDGSTVYGTPASSSLLRISSSLTVICWVDLTAINSSGSLLRTILACDGTTSGIADNTQFALFVDNTGALVYKHEHDSAIPVLFKTAGSTVMIGRFYSIAITRTITAGVASVGLYINNAPVAWASITDNGVSTLTPQAPNGGSTASYQIGRANKPSDNAYWDGLIDEVSVHNVSRPNQPYLIAAYYRVVLSAASTRLTAYNNIQSIGAAEMGGGNRWWTYQRDQDLYVIRESSLGLFSNEIKLTTSGTNPFSAPLPSVSSQPELVYDSASDTLFIAFLVGGRIYKITATAEDTPATENMPYTPDLTNIMKLQDSTEASRFGGGRGNTFVMAGLGGDGGLMSEATPIAPVLQFINVPSFGIAINNTNPYGYAIYAVNAGSGHLIGTVTSPYFGNGFNGTYYFMSISSRTFATQYYARPIRRNGSFGTNYSNIITDWLGQAVPLQPGDTLDLKVNSDGGDIPDSGTIGGGEADNFPNQAQVIFVNRTPLKLPYSDPDTSLNTLGGGEADSFAQQYLVTYVNRTPLKLSYIDPDTPLNTLGAGGTDHLIIGSSTRGTITL